MSLHVVNPTALTTHPQQNQTPAVYRAVLQDTPKSPYDIQQLTNQTYEDVVRDLERLDDADLVQETGEYETVYAPVDPVIASETVDDVVALRTTTQLDLALAVFAADGGSTDDIRAYLEGDVGDISRTAHRLADKGYLTVDKESVNGQERNWYRPTWETDDMGTDLYMGDTGRLIAQGRATDLTEVHHDILFDKVQQHRERSEAPDTFYKDDLYPSLSTVLDVSVPTSVFDNTLFPVWQEDYLRDASSPGWRQLFTYRYEPREDVSPSRQS